MPGLENIIICAVQKWIVVQSSLYNLELSGNISPAAASGSSSFQVPVQIMLSSAYYATERTIKSTWS